MKFRGNPKATDIARLHEQLATARLALEAAAFMKDERHHCVLTSASIDQLMRLKDRVSSALLSLEGPFFAATGHDRSGPLVDTDHPRAWLDWLGAKATGKLPRGAMPPAKPPTAASAPVEASLVGTQAQPVPAPTAGDELLEFYERPRQRRFSGAGRCASASAACSRPKPWGTARPKAARA